MSRPDKERRISNGFVFRAIEGAVAIGNWFGERPTLLAIIAGLGLVSGYFVGSTGFWFIVALLSLDILWVIAKKSGRYRHGLIFALVYFLPITNWLGVFVGRWTKSPFLYGLAWGFVALGLSLPLATIVPIASRLLKGRGIWAIPFVWIALELFRSYVPVLAFPWGLLAHPLANDRLPALFGLIGEYGMGGVVIGVSLWTSRLQQRSGERAPASAFTGLPLPLVGFLVIFLLSGVFRRESGKPDLTLAAYGSGLDLAYGPYAESGPMRNLAMQDRIATARREQQMQKADLMVLPEGLISSSSKADLPALTGGGTLLLGGQRHVGGDAFQTAFAFDGSTGKWESADKTRLVIFGEFVPGRGVIPYPPSFALPGGDLAAASELRMIDAHAQDGRPFRIGPILCFEALFPDISYRQKLKGAEVLAVMSLDDWFGGTKAPEWLELASRWRAAETGLPLVRVGSLGRTSLIDARGKVRRSLDWGEAGTITWNPSRD